MPPTASLDRVLVCVPTYNELDALPALLEQLRTLHPEVDVLVIDDSSPDGTGHLADWFARQDPHLNVLHRPGKAGLGAAYRAGFAWGLRHGYDLLVEMDADGSHRPEDLAALLTAAQDADVVLGTRWMRGGRTVNWPLRRKLLSIAGNLYARIMLRVPVSDITGGYRVYRAGALHLLDPHTVTSQGYCFQVELAHRAHLAGLAIRQVPITFVERSCGASKMSSAIVREAIQQVTRWGIQQRLHRPQPATLQAQHR